MQALFTLVGLLGIVVTGVLIALKMSGQFEGSWLTVFAPLFVDVALFIVLVAAVSLINGTTSSLSDFGSFFRRRRRMRAVLEQPEPKFDQAPRSDDSSTWWERK
jgi:hypothetical protein